LSIIKSGEEYPIPFKFELILQTTNTSKEMNTNTAILKNNLHKLILETDDESVLSKVQAFFDTLRNSQNDWWDTLSEPEIEYINKGLAQLDNGERIPNEEVMHKVDKLLSK